MPKTTIEHEPWCVKHANDGYGEICQSVTVDISDGLAVWGVRVESEPVRLAIDSGSIADKNLDRMLSHLTPVQARMLACLFEAGGDELIEAVYKVADAIEMQPAD